MKSNEEITDAIRFPGELLKTDGIERKPLSAAMCAYFVFQQKPTDGCGTGLKTHDKNLQGSKVGTRGWERRVLLFDPGSVLVSGWK